MARPRSIPDTVIFDTVLEMLEARGAVSFGVVSAAVGLAAPSLVQRYGDREGMLNAALIHGWDGVEAATRAADAAEDSAQGFLKGRAAGVADLGVLGGRGRGGAGCPVARGGGGGGGAQGRVQGRGSGDDLCGLAGADAVGRGGGRGVPFARCGEADRLARPR